MKTCRNRVVLTALVPGTLVMLAGCSSTPSWTVLPSGKPVVAEPLRANTTADLPVKSQPIAVQPRMAETPSDDAAIVSGVSRMTFAEEGADFDPCISHDGTMLVFSSTQHRNTADIYVKRTDSRVVTQLTNDPAQDAMPVISPDGTKIAFASDRTGNWDIYVMPITGGRAVQVTSDPSDEVHPSWSPDGKQMVFSRRGQSSNRWEMWTTDVSNPSVANFIGYGLLPQWCPIASTGQNGSERILFQLGRERGRHTFSLWTVDVANGNATNLTEIASSTNTALIDPSWSPDGKWIAYTEVPASTSSDEKARPAWATLWMLSAEGEGKVRLTGGTGLALSPAWGTNNRLFFVSDRSGMDNIWSLDLSPAIHAAQAAMNGTGQPVATAPAAAHAPAAHAPAVETHAKPEPVATAPEHEPEEHH